MKPGIYDIPDAQYFAADGINNSGLKEIRRSPAHFKYRQDNPKEPTAAMKAGTALHCAILEPGAFMNRFAIMPDNCPRRPTQRQIEAKKPSQATTDAIAFWTMWDLDNAGKQTMTATDAAEYLEIGCMVRQHPEVAPFFNREGRAEHAVFGIDPITKMLCKVKPDYLTVFKTYNICLEVKSTDDARPAAFQRTAYNFGYFQAAAFYQDVIKWSGQPPIDLYLILAFERTAPYGMKLYEVPDSELDRGRDQYMAAMAVYKECLDADYWPAYDTEIETLEFPAWAKD